MIHLQNKVFHVVIKAKFCTLSQSTVDLLKAILQFAGVCLANITWLPVVDSSFLSCTYFVPRDLMLFLCFLIVIPKGVEHNDLDFGKVFECVVDTNKRALRNQGPSYWVLTYLLETCVVNSIILSCFTFMVIEQKKMSLFLLHTHVFPCRLREDFCL